jgi:hypothetical protein
MFDGQCSCGEVKFTLTSKPMFVHCCHCFDCQRQTGSAFVLNALIETDRIRVTGEPEAIAMPTESGRPHDIYRCKTCKVAVWSDYGRRPKLRFVRVGTLKEPHAIQPDAHIFVRSKVPWVAIPEGQPAFEVFYNLEQQWPAESLERRKAIIG